MAHFAKIDNSNKVELVVVVHNNELLDESGIESEQNGIDFCVNLFGGQWVQTSYNHNMRKQYAGIGYTYDAVNDVFVSPPPYPSWLLDGNFDWVPPIPRPQENYMWDELSLSWIDPLDVLDDFVD